jgi:putative SOS response-associated peptidase YedK
MCVVFMGARTCGPSNLRSARRNNIRDRGTKKDPEEGEHRLYGFLTTEANADVRPIHSKAMPAILTTAEECDAWLSAPLAGALKLQRPLPDGALQIVAMVEKPDAWPAAAQ